MATKESIDFDGLIRSIYVDVVPDAFWKPLPETLWHYTTIEALFGIVENNEIWLSDFRQLNDKKEIRNSIKEIIAICNEKVEKNGLTKKLLKNNIEVFDTLSIIENHVFIFSLTENGDDLSQWKGYANCKSGISIGFDLESMEEVYGKESEDVYIGKVVYDLETKEEILSKYFSELKKLTDSFGSFTDDEIEQIIVQVELFLEICSVCFKSNEWKSENEFRIIAIDRNFNNVKFKVKNGRILPYGSITIDPKTCIKKIRLLDSELERKTMLAEYFNFKNVNEVDVDFSGVKMRFD